MSVFAWWWALLILQQASQTLVTRARASRSLSYHAAASVFSNGVWAGSQLVIIGTFTDLISHPIPLKIALTLGYYVSFCVVGSVGAHWALLRFVESARVSERV